MQPMTALWISVWVWLQVYNFNNSCFLGFKGLEFKGEMCSWYISHYNSTTTRAIDLIKGGGELGTSTLFQ